MLLVKIVEKNFSKLTYNGRQLGADDSCAKMRLGAVYKLNNNNNKVMEKFNADWDKRLLKETADDIIKNGVRLGEGGKEKDCYWAGYRKDEKYYISLNDDVDCFWEASVEDMLLHCT